MSLTKQEVEHIAKLGRLSLTEEEIKDYGKTLNDILGYIEVLNELDTTGVEPMVGALEFLHITRPDETLDLSKDVDLNVIVDNAPDREDTFFKIPKIAKG